MTSTFWTEEHRLLDASLTRFVSKHVESQAEMHDQAGTFNQALFRKLHELDLLGLTIPTEAGGGGMDVLATVIAHTRLAFSDPGFALAYLAHALLFTNNFYQMSSQSQRKRYLDKVISGAWIGAMGMTEPSCGTDIFNIKTTAIKKDDHYVINGRKIFITNAPVADIFLIYAKMNDKLVTFVVEQGFKGLSLGSATSKMGMRSSSMCEVIFEDCIVPQENLLSDAKDSVIHMMSNLEIERMGLAGISLGIAERCFDIMTRYAQDRETFGVPIYKHGQIQRYIGESYAKLEAMRALIYTVCAAMDDRKNNRLKTDAVKLFCSTAAKEIADAAMQVLGGYGYCTEFRVEQMLRDAKLLEIGGGTIEAHQRNITRDICEA